MASQRGQAPADPVRTGDPRIAALLEGRLGDPFALLGPHVEEGGITVRSVQPGARQVELGWRGERLAMAEVADGLWQGRVDGTTRPAPTDYLIHIFWPGGEQQIEDPYAFGLLLGELDLHLLHQGRHLDLGHCLGARPMTIAGVPGVRFAVWAPNARRVSVVGDFNHWDGRRHPMRLRLEAGVWELFIPRLQPGSRYQYELLGPHGLLPLKADPVARRCEPPPATASVVAAPLEHAWEDGQWLAQRPARQRFDAPLSIYEVHAASWRRPPSGEADWRWLADELVPYAVDLGFTHLELLPITGHPFAGSWGYQSLSLFAPHAPLGSPDDLAAFIDRCHQAELGVLLDWVPGHFPTDAHGLARFDGSALYEHEDPREGFHLDWNTLIYNLGRNEVRGFLIASALYWLEEFHFDGLRVDAVASMLYRDYSRPPGEWVPNRHGGRENLEAIDFLRELNQTVADRVPGALVIAEESTAWPGVTAPVEEGGLGFSGKWNMGWMHDTLSYMQVDPLFRGHHHQALTFGLVYAFSERFILPISHDEVVHGKGSLLGRMPGDPWQQLAGVRATLAWMWTHPGKKLLFMGSELAQPGEWDHDGQLPWTLLGDAGHRGVHRLVQDLNRLYRRWPALHREEDRPTGFAWVVGDDRRNSVLAFLRQAWGEASLLVVANFTPVPRAHYRLGVPRGGYWKELINSDGSDYGGSNLGNCGGAMAQPGESHGQPWFLELTLPPLAVLVLTPNPEESEVDHG